MYVQIERFRNAQQIATNEERAAPNIKPGGGARLLGYVTDGNIDFVCALPAGRRCGLLGSVHPLPPP